MPAPSGGDDVRLGVIPRQPGVCAGPSPTGTERCRSVGTDDELGPLLNDLSALVDGGGDPAAIAKVAKAWLDPRPGATHG